MNISKKALVIGMYPKEANPQFALKLVDALDSIGYDTYAIIPANIDNIDRWNKYVNCGHVFFVHNEKGSGVVARIRKYTNIARYITIDRQKMKGFLKDIRFDLTFFTFYHRWNELVMREIDSRKFIAFLHDPEVHSGTDSVIQAREIAQMQKMDDVIVLSKKFITLTEKNYHINKRHIHFMPHCLFYGTKNVLEADEHLNDSTPINFLFFGRITEYKGIDILLSAYHNLEQYNSNVHLTIAGNGDFSKYKGLFDTCKNSMLINRYINEDEIPKIFNKENTVVVLPYTDATQSGVISIAYSFGCPVISSDTGGLREQLCDGECGLFFEPNNSIALENTMNKIEKNRLIMHEETIKMINQSKKLDWIVATKDVIRDINEEVR